MNRVASHKTFAVLTVLVALLAAGWAQAETTPEARAWLEKMMVLYQQGAFTVGYSADMSLTQQDQTMSMSMEGEMTQADPEHFRMDISMDMQMPGAGPMKMGMLTVTDGSTVWIDMDNPMMGGRRVMKMTLEQAQEMGGGMGMSQIRSMDPVAQMKEMMENFDFRVDREGDGEVVLSAPLDPEALKGMGQMGQMAQGQATDEWRMTLVLDADKGLPKTVHMGDVDAPMMTVNFTDWRFHGEAGAPAGTFDYTPPEGVQVMDMGAMAGGGAQPGGGGQ